MIESRRAGQSWRFIKTSTFKSTIKTGVMALILSYLHNHFREVVASEMFFSTVVLDSRVAIIGTHELN